MNRRKFVSLGTASLCVMPVLGFSAFNKKEYGMETTKPTWLIELIKLNDEQVKAMATSKIKNTSNRYFGGYLDGDEIPNPWSNAGFIMSAANAISSSESSLYRSQELIKNIGEAIAALLKMQHTDGTIDLLQTNFHSTPDTGFMVKRMVPAYKLLAQSKTPGAEKVLVAIKIFLQNAGEALSTGGIHTPNHRWVVSAALTKLNELWPDIRYVKRIEQWLAEHIDLDPDGQYTEKSTSGYSAVVDRVLITVSIGLQKPEILDAVRKNIMMMRYYIHPNGEVVTEASNRQDKGQIGTMENYYYACRYLALLDNNGEMAAICRLIEKKSFSSLVGVLGYLLEDPTLWRELPGSKALPTSYVKSFPYSGVVRIRRGEWDATILSNNPTWITFHKGNAILQGMRVAASFFGKGQFESDEIKEVGNNWVLTKKLEGPYYQPFENEFIRADGDLSKVPKSNRKKSNIQYFETIVTIAENSNGLVADIELSGTDGVPVSLELIFRKGGTFSGTQPHPTKADAFLFKEGKGSYTVGKDTIHFSPGRLEHKGIQLRGALPPMDAATVYLTGFTPFKHRIQLS